MAEKKTKEQIEADILKEATAAAAKEKKEAHPASRKPQTEKPTTKEKLAGAGSGKGGIVGKALETVKTLKAAPEKKERKIKLERVYTVPIRELCSRTRRTKIAVRNLRNFVQRHTKAKEIKINEELNSFIWQRGYKKPPIRVRVSVSVDEEGLAIVSLKK